MKTLTDPSLIIAIACREMGIDTREFLGIGRHPRIIACRMICAHLIRKHTHLSFPEIAVVMGRPNHSSVITMHKRFKQNFQEDGALLVGVSARGMVRVEDAGKALYMVEAGIGK